MDDGTYRIGWSFAWTQTKLNQEFLAQVQVNDTDTIFDLAISPYVDVGYFASVTGFFFQTLVSGIHYIDLDFATSDASSTSRIQNVRLEFWRVE